MRTTIEMNDDLHECMRRQAQREGISLAKLLGRMVETAVSASQGVSATCQSSGRFTVIASKPSSRTQSQAVQKVIDEEGILCHSYHPASPSGKTPILSETPVTLAQAGVYKR